MIGMNIVNKKIQYYDFEKIKTMFKFEFKLINPLIFVFAIFVQSNLFFLCCDRSHVWQWPVIESGADGSLNEDAPRYGCQKRNFFKDVKI